MQFILLGYLSDLGRRNAVRKRIGYKPFCFNNKIVKKPEDNK